MAALRALKAPRKTTKTSRAEATDGDSQSASAGASRIVADMLRDLQIDGKALSAQMERLRQRFA